MTKTALVHRLGLPCAVLLTCLLAAPLAVRGQADQAVGPETPKPLAGNTTTEQILLAGDVVEISEHTVKRIPLSQAPKQLRDALGDTDSFSPTGH